MTSPIPTKENSTSRSHLPLPLGLKSSSESTVDHQLRQTWLRTADWEKLENLLGVIGKTSTKPESLSALYRIRSLIAHRKGTGRQTLMLQNRPFSSTYPLTPGSASSYRTSMFLLDNQSANRSGSIRTANRIQDMFNGTFFATSYRDISDANALDWRSSNSDNSSRRRSRKATRDKNYIKRHDRKTSNR